MLIDHLKKSCLFWLGFFILQGGYAQTRTNSDLIRFNGNYAIPSGNFGSKKISNNAAGYAQPGPQIQLIYEFKKRHTLGAELIILAQEHLFSSVSLSNKLENSGLQVGFWCGSSINDPLYLPSNPVKYSNWQFVKKRWKLIAAMGGVNRYFSISKQKSIVLKTFFRAGLAYAYCPELNGNSMDTARSAFIKQSGQTGWGILTDAGFSMDYPIQKKWFLFSNLDFTYSNPILFKQVKSSITTISGNPGSSNYNLSNYTVSGEVMQVIQTWNFGIGIGYKL